MTRQAEFASRVAPVNEGDGRLKSQVTATFTVVCGPEDYAQALPSYAHIRRLPLTIFLYQRHNMEEKQPRASRRSVSFNPEAPTFSPTAAETSMSTGLAGLTPPTSPRQKPKMGDVFDGKSSRPPAPLARLIGLQKTRLSGLIGICDPTTRATKSSSSEQPRGSHSSRRTCHWILFRRC